MHYLCDEQTYTVSGGFNPNSPYDNSGESARIMDLLRDWSKPMPVNNDAPKAR